MMINTTRDHRPRSMGGATKPRCSSSSIAGVVGASVRRRSRCGSGGLVAVAAAAAADSVPASSSPDADADASPSDPAQTPAAAAAAAAAAGAPKKSGAHWVVSEGLASVPITIVGDDDDLNWAVCRALAKRVGWFPASTAKVLCGMHKAGSVKELVEREGAEAVAKYEAEVLRGMRDQRRVCVATLAQGASASPSIYDSLYGSVIVWVDEHDRRAPKQDSPLRRLWRARAELPTRLDAPTGFAARRRAADDKAKEAVAPIVKGLLQLLKENPELPARKILYAEMGYRGDWPDLQPPEWNPVLDRMGARPDDEGGAAAAAAAAE